MRCGLRSRAGGLLRSLLAVALAGLLAGCFVVDELDKGAQLMEGPPGKRKAAERAREKAEIEEAIAASAPLTGDSPERARGESWWQSITTFTRGELGDEFVRCDVQGSSQFMKRDDCLALGGKALARR